MKKILPFLVVIVSIAAYSCKKAEGPAPDALKKILLGKDTLLMHVGDVEQVNFTLNPSNYSTNSLVWKSSDSTIIAVTQTGTLTAEKEGSAIITVSNKASTVSVNVLITVLPKAQAVDSLKVGLIAYYAFNNNAVDSSGNNNNGTVYNAVSTTDRFGNANSAYQFDGTSSYITVPDNQALRLSHTDFTINYWVNLDEYTVLSGSAVLS
ncbi:MAG: Ig-like domain-containing protein, partial [Bacteroidetes bacterium]|nr:Ig-like domain-containing protein [Bacteroidota bacterium]